MLGFVLFVLIIAIFAIVYVLRQSRKARLARERATQDASKSIESATSISDHSDGMEEEGAESVISDQEDEDENESEDESEDKSQDDELPAESGGADPEEEEKYEWDSVITRGNHTFMYNEDGLCLDSQKQYEFIADSLEKFEQDHPELELIEWRIIHTPDYVDNDGDNCFGWPHTLYLRHRPRPIPAANDAQMAASVQVE